MRDGTKFSTWKDFALAVCEEVDGLTDDVENLKKNYDDLKEDYKEFKTRVYTVVTIIIIVFGTIEISVRL